MKTLYIGLFLALGMAVVGGYGAGVSKKETAVFAGGDFRFLEKAFGDTYGVVRVEVGYTGGTVSNPSAKNFASGGHVAAVRVTYMPDRISYSELMDVFWRNVDPTDGAGQFSDRGAQFRTVVFWIDQAQKTQAEASKAALAKSGRFKADLKTEIVKAGQFYPAPEADRNFAEKKPAEFTRLLAQSGRREFLEKTWGPEAVVERGLPPIVTGGTYKKPSRDELAKKLTPMQFDVTQNEGTEPPFNNEYWDNHEEGIYVDIVSGEPLFSSRDKFESGTGWPSFFLPLEPGNIKLERDASFGMVRTEVRSEHADSHLGHLFEDGPEPTGLRYCMDSASLRFIPVKDLVKEGYGKYLEYFKK